MALYVDVNHNSLNTIGVGVEEIVVYEHKMGTGNHSAPNSNFYWGTVFVPKSEGKLAEVKPGGCFCVVKSPQSSTP